MKEIREGKEVAEQARKKTRGKGKKARRKSRGPSIDWEDLRRGYNRIKRTKYKSVKEMLIYEHEIYGLRKFSVILGVSPGALTLKRREIKILFLKSGGVSTVRVMEMLSSSGRLENMKVKEIYRLTGISNKRVWRICRDKDLKYKKNGRKI